jgi:hypothetical protein
MNHDLTVQLILHLENQFAVTDRLGLAVRGSLSLPHAASWMFRRQYSREPLRCESDASALTASTAKMNKAAILDSYPRYDI